MAPVLENLVDQIVILVDVVFESPLPRGKRLGGEPITLLLSDLPYYDTSVDPPAIYAHLLERVDQTELSRVSGSNLTTGSTPDGGLLRTTTTPSLRNDIEELTCENRPLLIRKGRQSEPLSAFKTVFNGLAQGSEYTGTRLTITPLSVADLLEREYQPAVWEGRGRQVHVDDSLNGGSLLVPVPADPTDWDIATTFMTLELEADFDGSASAVEEICKRDDTFKVRRNAAGFVEVEWIRLVGGSLLLTGNSSIAAAGRYAIAVTWRNTTTILSIYVNGQFDILTSSATAPVAATTDPFIMGGGAAGGVQMIGSVRRLRYWVGIDRASSIPTTFGPEPLDPGDDVGLEINLDFTEGFGRKTFDNARGHFAILQENAQWITTGTGDPHLRGERKPSCFGHQKVAPVLIDEIGEVYAIHFRSVSSIVPSVGGKQLAGVWSVTGTVSFVAVDRVIRGEPGGIDLSDLVAHQSIEITDSVDNDRVFQTQEAARLFGTTWEVKVHEVPVDEAATGGVTIESVTSETQKVIETFSADFDATTRTVRAPVGAYLGDFNPLRTVLVTGGGSLNDGRSFVIDRTPWKDSDERWNIEFTEAPETEAAVVVTLLQPTNLGEYTLDLARGQFRLHFKPQRKVSAVVDGDAVGGYVETVTEIAVRMLGIMGSDLTRAFLINQAHIDLLQPAFDWRAGHYDPGGPGKTTFRSVLDHLHLGVGLYWFISPRDQRFSMTDLPPTANVINRDLDAQERAFSIVHKRSVKRRGHVEVLYDHNPVVLVGDELAFALRHDQSTAGKELAEKLGQEWQSAVFPEGGADESLEPYVVESALTDRTEALELAEYLDGFFGRSQTWYELAIGTELQAQEPWLLEIALSDPETESLVVARDSYPVLIKDGPFESMVSLLIIEEAPPP